MFDNTDIRSFHSNLCTGRLVVGLEQLCERTTEKVLAVGREVLVACSTGTQARAHRRDPVVRLGRLVQQLVRKNQY